MQSLHRVRSRLTALRLRPWQRINPRDLYSEQNRAFIFQLNRVASCHLHNSQQARCLLTDQSTKSIDKIDLTFRETKQAYKSKTSFELFRGILVLTLSQFSFLVNNHAMLTKWGRQVLGQKLFHKLMKATFYGQFVAGEDEIKIRPSLDRLRSFGVKSILDYSAEEDISGDSQKEAEQAPNDADDTEKKYKYDQAVAHRKSNRPVARTYFYLNEANCEKNMEIFLRCIDAVAGATHGTGFAAIKLTALGRPELLLQLSEVIARVREYYQQITGGDTMIFGNISPEAFQQQLDRRFHIKSKNPEFEQFFQRMDYDTRGMINLFCWNGLVETQSLVNDLFRVPNLKSGRMEPIIHALSPEEEEMLRNMMRRIHTICQVATERNVRVLVDAEQTYFQPAINRITMELMRKYNKEKAIIFNTYQCYLKNAFENCQIDAELSRRQNFYFGAKLVRGAYLEQERLRANELGYEDPTNPNFDATTAMYERNLDFFMNKIVENDGLETKKFAIMVASHNENTVRYTLNRMNELGIRPEHKVICFGQLYGMSDHVSFNLGQSGYSVYKYVPYGPIDEVLPYMSRRALENHGILANSRVERSLMFKELSRRLFTGQIAHKPNGNYQII